MTNNDHYEKVTFAASPLNNGEFIPLVEVGSTGNTRPFVASDMSRVLDFPNMPSPPPPSAPHGHLEFEMDDDDQTIRDDAPPQFPKRFFCLRGSFIFYFDLGDVALQDRRRLQGQNAQDLPNFLNGPIGVIPLERTTVEFPPGGRRVFREHANTDATQGYELMIRHVPARTSNAAEDLSGGGPVTGTKITKRRAPAYLVMESLGQRDAWAEAIRVRAEAYRKETKLRLTGDGSMDGMALVDSTFVDDVEGERKESIVRSSSPSRAKFGSRPIGGDISLLAGVMEAEEQKDVDEALRMFGSQTFFQEKDWVHDFYKNHDEVEGKELCEKLERWQISIKKGLRGAVLEQYEYFVEASKEMTQMGREVASLKELVQKQVEMFESMKRINFNLDLGRPGGSIFDADKGENAMIEDETTTRDSSDDDDDEDDDEDDDFNNDENETSKSSPLSRKKQQPSVRVRKKRGVTSPLSKSSSKRSNNTIDIPIWIDDAVDEISALVKEYRYSEAAELLMKAKLEVKDILNLVRTVPSRLTVVALCMLCFVKKEKQILTMYFFLLPSIHYKRMKNLLKRSYPKGILVR